jgi:hypothetical protein
LKRNYGGGRRERKKVTCETEKMELLLLDSLRRLQIRKLFFLLRLIFSACENQTAKAPVAAAFSKESPKLINVYPI